MNVVTPIWQKAAEFGVMAFLLVLCVLGFGFIIYKLGDRLATSSEKSMERQAKASEDTAKATEKIGDLAAAIYAHAEETQRLVLQGGSTLNMVHDRVKRTGTAMRDVIEAVHSLTPEEKSRVRELLSNARRRLEQD